MRMEGGPRGDGPLLVFSVLKITRLLREYFPIINDAPPHFFLFVLYLDAMTAVIPRVTIVGVEDAEKGCERYLGG
jgi:hypothetical protein